LRAQQHAPQACALPEPEHTLLEFVDQRTVQRVASLLLRKGEDRQAILEGARDLRTTA